ncbi:MAG: hypothetical protein ABUS79_17160 [Pseudomonadota bacterium]
MSDKVRPNFLAIAVAAVIAASGAAVIVQGIQVGMEGLRGMRLLAFCLGVVICATGVFLFRREMRRRARAAAIARLLPRYRARRRAWNSAVGDPGNVDSFLFNDSDWYDEASERVPASGAQVREATRALLVSLEDELRRERTANARRAGRRPACRRARLRAAGRSEARRRRVSVRPPAFTS